jgi:hypothetical protein
MVIPYRSRGEVSMETMAEMTGIMNETRELLKHVIRQMEGYTHRIEELMREITRIKDGQNDIIAGLALYERVRRLKESLGTDEKPAEIDESTWDSIRAYCRNCTSMVPIIEPRANFSDEHTVVEARCRHCGTMVVRTLL